MPAGATAKNRHPPSTEATYSARVREKVTPFPKLLERVTRRDSSYRTRQFHDLVELLAAGRPTPGAGSLDGLAGALAGASIQSVAQYTLKAAEQQAHYKDIQPRAEEIWRLSKQISLALEEDAQEDEKAYSTYRALADAVRTTVRPADRDQLMAAKDEALKWSTVVPFRISTACKELTEMGLELLDRGYKEARSECLSAVTIALGSSEGAAHTVTVNLGKIRDALWAHEQQESLQVREVELLRLRSHLLKRVHRPELLQAVAESWTSAKEPAWGWALMAEADRARHGLAAASEDAGPTR
jgi:formiminotetrahydrofolate cyclodeaminase